MNNEINDGFRPCPFCGSTDVRSSFSHWSGFYGAPNYAAYCSDCGVRGAYVRTGDEAAKKWNERAMAPFVEEGGKI